MNQSIKDVRVHKGAVRMIVADSHGEQAYLRLGGTIWYEPIPGDDEDAWIRMSSFDGARMEILWQDYLSDQEEEDDDGK